MIINKNFGIDDLNAEIDNDTKILLLNRAMTDRRLNAKDLKLFLFLLNSSNSEYTQEQIGDILDIARANINRSSVKLETFGYISKSQTSRRKAIQYDIETDLNESGLSIPLVPCANLEKTTTSSRINEDDEDSLKEEYSLIGDIVRARVNGKVHIDKNIMNDILFDFRLKMLLFLVCSENPKLSYFKEKYLENTFRMIISNYNFKYKEEFIAVYCCCEDDTDEKTYTYNDLMLLLGDEHRDVKINRDCRKVDLAVSYADFCTNVSKLFSVANTIEKVELKPLESVLDNIDIDTPRFLEGEFLILLYLKGAQERFRIYTGIKLEIYMKIKHIELYEALLTYESLLKRYEVEGDKNN